jgi:Kef-type K+ transport system membrane component KefB
MNGKTQNDIFRMIAWLLIGLLCYALAFALGNSRPIPQMVCQKLGNVLTFAWVGYWVSRTAIGRVSRSADAYLWPEIANRISRALIIGCAILAGAMGL